MSVLGAYVQTSTANPLGNRPLGFALKSPMSSNPRPSVALSGYYPADYFVPTPMNIQIQPVPNVLGGLTDFLSENSTLLLGLAVVGALWYVMKEPRRGRAR